MSDTHLSDYSFTNERNVWRMLLQRRQRGEDRRVLSLSGGSGSGSRAQVVRTARRKERMNQPLTSSYVTDSRGQLEEEDAYQNFELAGSLTCTNLDHNTPN